MLKPCSVTHGFVAIDRTRTLSALLLLLRCPPPVIAASGDDVQFRFADLVVKCLIKLTKALQTSLSVRTPQSYAFRLYFLADKPVEQLLCVHAPGRGPVCAHGCHPRVFHGPGG